MRMGEYSRSPGVGYRRATPSIGVRFSAPPDPLEQALRDDLRTLGAEVVAVGAPQAGLSAQQLGEVEEVDARRRGRRTRVGDEPRLEHPLVAPGDQPPEGCDDHDRRVGPGLARGGEEALERRRALV